MFKKKFSGLDVGNDSVRSSHLSPLSRKSRSPEVLLTATAQNLRRVIKFLFRPTPLQLAV
jgi:hypothetical protein